MPTLPLAHRIGGVRLSPIREVNVKIQRAARQGIEIANLASGRLDLDSPANAKQATTAAMDQGWVHYAHSMGREDLRRALARRLGRDFQLEIDPNRLIITLGGTEAMYVALQTMLNPGDEVLVPEPMYVYYQGWATLGGAEMVPVPLDPKDGFSLRAEQVRSRLSPRTKALIINSPHNPTGQVFAEPELRAIARLARDHDFYVVCDEVYSYLVYEDAVHFPVAAAPGMESRVILVGSLSKTYAMDGWRVGYLTGPRDFMAEAIKTHQYAVGSANTFVQFGAREVLEGSQKFVREALRKLTRRRALVLAGLDEMRIPYVRPKGAFYVFPDISRFGYSSQGFSDLLFSRAGVAVVPGSAFGPGGEGHVRIAFGRPYRDIEAAMERIRATLERL